MDKLILAARRVLEAHERGEFRELRVWATGGELKVVGRKAWNPNDEK